MNAKIIVCLLIGAFVLPGCARFKEKLIEAKKARDAEYLAKKAEMDKVHEEHNAFLQKIEAEQAEFEKHIKEYGEVQAEFLAWYNSLSPEQQSIFDRELEEKEIRYNQIHGFNPDGSSRYLNHEGGYWDDRLKLMHHYQTIWDNEN